MLKSFNRRLFTACLAVVFVLFGLTSSYAFTPKGTSTPHTAAGRVVFISNGFLRAPIKIKNISNGFLTASNPTPSISNGFAWLRGFKVDFENVSGRTVPAATITMLVKLSNHPEPLNFQLQYGGIPGVDSISAQPIANGGTGSMSLTDEEFDSLAQSAQATNSDVTSVTLKTGAVFFENNSAWYVGKMMNPVGPGEWAVSQSNSVPHIIEQGCGYELDGMRTITCCKIPKKTTTEAVLTPSSSGEYELGTASVSCGIKIFKCSVDIAIMCVEIDVEPFVLGVTVNLS